MTNNSVVPARYSIVGLLALLSMVLTGSRFFPGTRPDDTEAVRLPALRQPALRQPAPPAIPRLPEAVRERLTARGAPIPLADASPDDERNPFLPLNVRRPARRKVEARP